MDSDALYREVTEKHGVALGRLAAIYERDPERRRSLLQEMHASIWKSLVFFDQRTALSTWVYRVAHNVGAAHLSEREGVLFEEREKPVEAGPLLPRALGLLHSLPPLDRQVLALFLEGTDALAIAEIIGLSPSDVALRLHQSKTALMHRVSPSLDEATLRARWREARSQLPTAFMIPELRDRGLEGTSRPTKDFLEKRLVDLRSDRRFRMAGSLLLVPLVLLLVPASAHSGWALLAVLAVMGIVLVALTKLWLAISATTTALLAMRPSGESGTSSARSMFFGLLLIAGTIVVGVATYKFSSVRRTQELGSKQGVEARLARCLDPQRSTDPECITVLRRTGRNSGASPQTSDCGQKWLAYSSRERPASTTPEPQISDDGKLKADVARSNPRADASYFLKNRAAKTDQSKSDDEVYDEEPRAGELEYLSAKTEAASVRRERMLEEHAFSESLLFDGVPLAAECPGELMLPAALLKKDLVDNVIESSRTACLHEANSDKVADALAVCETYARYACQGKSAEWRSRNEAFLTFMSVRERLAVEAQQPWDCVDSPLVGLLQALSASTPEGVSLTWFSTKSGVAVLMGSARNPLEVTELNGRLGDIVRTPSGLGRVVHRSADGSAGVKLLGRLDEMELAASEMKALFAPGEMTALTALTEVRGPDGGTASFEFTLSVGMNRDALPNGKEWVARYAPDVIAEHYVAVVRDAPENAEAWLSLGYAHKARSKPEEAIAAFKKYLELRPETATRKQLEDQIYFLGGQ